MCCALQANDKAKAVIAATWRGNNLQAADEAGLPGSSSVKDSVVDDSAHDDAESRLALMTFPVLLTETYVDEDTLARLFLVTSHMSSVLKVRSTASWVGGWVGWWVCKGTDSLVRGEGQGCKHRDSHKMVQIGMASCVFPTSRATSKHNHSTLQQQQLGRYPHPTAPVGPVLVRVYLKNSSMSSVCR